MAKKRKHKTAVRRRKGGRRVGAIKLMPSQETLMTVAGAAVGLAATGFILGKLPQTWSDKVKAGVATAGGLLLANQRNALLKGAGAGVAALGAYKLVNAFAPGTLPAISGAPYIMLDRAVAGYNSYPNNPQRNAIAGYNNFPNNPQVNTIAGVQARRAAGAGIA